MLNILTSDFFLPLGSVKLGRLVTSVDFPTKNYHDPPYAKAPEEKITVRGQYESVIHGAASSGFASKLTSLMSSGLAKRAKSQVRIESQQVKTYTLDNSEAWFREAAMLLETQDWIESAVGGDGIFLVVGFHTVVDAHIVYESVEGRQIGGHVSLPVGLSLAATGVIPPFGNALDPEVNAHRTVVDGAKAKYLAPGEQICALQYLKIAHRWIFTKGRDRLSLSKAPRWTARESWRRADMDQDEEPDIIEVQLEGLREVEGSWNREETDDGEVLLIRDVEQSYDL